MITFDQARDIVAEAPLVKDIWGDFTVLDWGWENAHVYVVVVENTDGEPTFDPPALLVDKRTGALIEKFGLLGADPAPDLVLIGNVPPGGP